MADAKKCDRCGDFYTMDDLFRLGNEEYINVKIFKCTSIGDGFKHSDDRYDLCPKCMEKLIAWLNGCAEIMFNTELEEIENMRKTIDVTSEEIAADLAAPDDGPCTDDSVYEEPVTVAEYDSPGGCDLM